MSVSPHSGEPEHVRHLYIHVPFCSGRCTYCAFYSEPYDRDRVRPYLQALRREFQCLLPDGRRIVPRTIYLGGGTPSVLADAELAALTQTITEFADLDELEEWTLEANPGTLGDGALDVVSGAGANRISLGVQSLTDTTLRRIGRRHDAAAVERTITRLRRHGFRNIGADLIACLPGVSAREWADTVRGVTQLELPHVSVYSLSLEPGSRLYADHQAGLVKSSCADDEIYALDRAEALLAQGGVERYEISNYARTGFECRHNLACWRGRDYLGVGPAAASRLGRVRRTNAASLQDYVGALLEGRLPPATEDTLSSVDDVTERFIFSLRLTGGTASSDFSPPAALATHWERVLRRLADQGIAAHEGEHWRLTERGLLIADSVAAELLPDSGTCWGTRLPD